MKENPLASSVTTKLYLYNYTAIADFKKEKRVKILFLLMNSNTKVMKNLNAFYTKIENFFFRQDNQTEFLSFFRIAIGIVILLQFAAVLPDFEKIIFKQQYYSSGHYECFYSRLVDNLLKIVSFFTNSRD